MVVAHRKINVQRLGRILSIDPRSRRVAWSYFKDGELQDCRIRNIRGNKLSVRIEQESTPYLLDLLEQYSPHALLVPRIRGGGTRGRSPQTAKVIRAIVREAVSRGIAVHVLSADAVKRTFSQPDGSPVRNLEDVNNAILDHYPELTTMVPTPRRKAWEPEEYFTPLFNTVGMYIAWQKQRSGPGD